VGKLQYTRAAVIRTLLDAAKLNGLSPTASLKGILEKLPTIHLQNSGNSS